MFPFELVATATDSPRDSPAGSLRKFGTEVNGISGTPVIVAFCWADAEPARSRTAAYIQKRCRGMGAAYTTARIGSITIQRQRGRRVDLSASRCPLPNKLHS